MDCVVKAMNLWEIEQKILAAQKELEGLHEMKDSLLCIPVIPELCCNSSDYSK